MQLTFVSQLLQRLASASPKFWKKIQLISAIMAGVCFAAGWLLSSDIFVINWLNKEKAVYWLDRAVTFFAGGGFSALLATKNPDLMNHETKEAVIKQVLGDKKSEQADAPAL